MMKVFDMCISGCSGRFLTAVLLLPVLQGNIF